MSRSRKEIEKTDCRFDREENDVFTGFPTLVRVAHFVIEREVYYT